MDDAMMIAVSGMGAASSRLTSAASNIVTMTSQGSTPATGSNSNASQQAAPPPPLAYDPNAPYANMQGMVEQPHDDLPAALVNLKEAQTSFRASLLAYKASSDMFKTLLDATA